MRFSILSVALLALSIAASAQTKIDINTQTKGNLTAARVAAGQLNLSTSRLLEEIPNNGTTGTFQKRIAKLDTSDPAKAIDSGTSLLGLYGIVFSATSTTGNAQICRAGRCTCTFANTAVKGDYVQSNGPTDSKCKDVGATYPTSNDVIGQVYDGGAAGDHEVIVFGIGTKDVSGSGGNVSGSGTTSKITKWSNGPGSVAADSAITDNGTVVDSTENIQAPAFVGTGAGAGFFDWVVGNGACPTPTAGHVQGCYSSNVLKVSNNGDALSQVLRAADKNVASGVAGLDANSRVLPANGGVPVMDTAAQGFFCLHQGYPCNFGASTTGTIVNAANTEAFWSFYLPFKSTFQKFSYEITTAVASSHTSFGIFSIDCSTKLWDSGLLDTSQTPAVYTVTGTLTTLEAGWYKGSWTTDTGTVALRVATRDAAAWIITNKNNAFIGRATTATSGGNQPSTCNAGGVTAVDFNLPQVRFER